MRKVILSIVLIGIIILGFRFYSRSQSKPNIIFITLDALRADHLGCYGYGRNTSPHIDSLAAQGASFTQAISQCPWTQASISSLLTSLYPNHEWRPKKFSLSPRDPNLIQLLKNNGYVTALFSGAYPILSSALENLKDEFDVFDITGAKPDILIKLAINWLNRYCKRPFFLWVYLFDPHGPIPHPFLITESSFPITSIAKGMFLLPKTMV